MFRRRSRALSSSQDENYISPDSDKEKICSSDSSHEDPKNTSLVKSKNMAPSSQEGSKKQNDSDPSNSSLESLDDGPTFQGVWRYGLNMGSSQPNNKRNQRENSPEPGPSRLRDIGPGLGKYINTESGHSRHRDTEPDSSCNEEQTSANDRNGISHKGTKAKLMIFENKNAVAVTR